MNKILLALLSFAMGAALVGCKNVEITDGRVPSQYLAKAKAYEGVYSGSFDGRSGQLILQFDGDRPVLSFENGIDNDLLATKCESQIGQLSNVYLTGRRNTKVKSVSFNFNPNNCRFSVNGRALVLELKESDGKTTLFASIHQYDRQQQECTVTGGDPARGVPPRHECRTTYHPIYLTGKFVK